MSTSVAESRENLDDLLSDEAINRPFEYYRRLREVHPVYWNPRWNGWIVTGYDAVIAGYRDSDRLSSDRFSGPFGAEMRRSASTFEQLIQFLSRFFVWKDPPFHTQMRLVVNRAFTPKSVEVLRPRVQELVRELTEPLRAGEAVDFLGTFAFTLPVVVIAEFLGVPPEARFEVRDWSEDLGAVIFMRGKEQDRLEKGEQAMRKLVDFLRPIIRDRIKNPKDDLLTRLATNDDSGARLSEEDVIANAVLMVFAGHETTMNLLANMVVAFEQFPDQWDRLYRDPSLEKSATEEILRFDGPIKGLGRWAKEPFEFFGQSIKQGDRMLLMQHAGNRDPQGFDDPDRLDIGRNPNRHAAFGQGIHTCLGAPLARIEVQEVLSYLTKAFETIETLNDTLLYNPTVVSRSLQSLHVKARPR
ncbi:cytochrome P450 [Rhodoligotrophos appendicifer]|uniref:cytochrome P450 n=1 Tax=Rhodoligotrophos appendicifer TaxID=987056 RepID=UPI0011872A34|nr:cytochrome P450 [Rhodoligotrophos appendicifer]